MSNSTTLLGLLSKDELIKIIEAQSYEYEYVIGRYKDICLENGISLTKCLDCKNLIDLGNEEEWSECCYDCQFGEGDGSAVCCKCHPDKYGRTVYGTCALEWWCNDCFQNNSQHFEEKVIHCVECKEEIIKIWCDRIHSSKIVNIYYFFCKKCKKSNK